MKNGSREVNKESRIVRMKKNWVSTNPNLSSRGAQDKLHIQKRRRLDSISYYSLEKTCWVQYNISSQTKEFFLSKNANVKILI
jgi:hypothetical protein